MLASPSRAAYFNQRYYGGNMGVSQASGSSPPIKEASARSAWNIRRDSESVVLCGSLRSSLSAFKEAYGDLTRDNIRVLSPNEPNVQGEDAGFVTFVNDHGTHAEVERRHLAAMERADQVLVLAPDGRIGASTAFELGYAYASGLPVAFAHRTTEPILQQLAETDCQGFPRPSPRSLPALQSYYADAAKRRGWAGETPSTILSLLEGEVEELGDALEPMRMEGERDSVPSELADVFLYVIHLANELGIDLHRAIVNKERLNHARFEDVHRE